MVALLNAKLHADGDGDVARGNYVIFLSQLSSQIEWTTQLTAF